MFVSSAVVDHYLRGTAAKASSLYWKPSCFKFDGVPAGALHRLTTAVLSSHHGFISKAIALLATRWQ